jgi:hypothetical protein
MELGLTTPALLFPTVSLLLLAYTNRFLATAGLIRSLHSQYQDNKSPFILGQIKSLRLRVRLIRDMQACGILSLFLCVLCMFLLFSGNITIAKYVFGVSLVLLMTSLGLSIYEIQMSMSALKIQLRDIEEND